MNYSTPGISFHGLRFKDFVPEQLAKAGWFTLAQHESLEELLGQIDRWIEKNPELMIVNIETVVLPNIHHPKEEGSTDPELVANQTDGTRVRWYQFFRVWYK